MPIEPQDRTDHYREVALRALRLEALNPLDPAQQPWATDAADNIENNCPLAIDLMAWTLWLRDSTDFFSGPNLDLQFPNYNDASFTRTLASNALHYTGE